MKYLNIIIMTTLISLLVACSDAEAPEVQLGMDQTVEILSNVTLGASAMSDDGMVGYLWTVTSPNGDNVTLDSNTESEIMFTALQEGDYTATVAVTNDGGTTTETGTITVTNPAYNTADIMGRPAINTVFNYFGGAEGKNGYNQTTPDGGNADPAAFKGIFDALQGYIGLEPDSYTNILGLDNLTTSTVSATDVLMSNKNFPTTYGPADLSDMRLGENLLNGRGLGDDVIDVTLILAFAGNDLTALSDLQAGLIGDGVAGNDQNFSAQFPYLANPN